jgi:hypothetical protein
MNRPSDFALRVVAPSIELLFAGAVLGFVVEGLATIAMGANNRPAGSLLNNIKFFAACGSVLGAVGGAVNAVMEDKAHRQQPSA